MHVQDIFSVHHALVDKTQWLICVVIVMSQSEYLAETKLSEQYILNYTKTQNKVITEMNTVASAGISGGV